MEITERDAGKYIFKIKGCGTNTHFMAHVFYKTFHFLYEKETGRAVVDKAGKHLKGSRVHNIKYCADCLLLNHNKKFCSKCDSSFQPSCNNKFLCFNCAEINSKKIDDL